MATDWIKMRVNLADDGRVVALACKLGAHSAHVVGALHWLWSKADQHTVDGKLHGYRPDYIDKHVGIPGFTQALSELTKAGKPRPWVNISDDFVSICEFGRHNGTTAKERATDARRKSTKRRENVRQPTGHLADTQRTFGGPRTRKEQEEKRTTTTVVVDVLSRLSIENLRDHANATPERLAWIEREADSKANPQAWAAQCIRKGWEVPPLTPEVKRSVERAAKEQQRHEAMAAFERMTSEEKRVVFDAMYQRFPNLVGKRIDQPGVRAAVADTVIERASEIEQGAAS